MFGPVVFVGVLIAPGLVELADFAVDPDYWDVLLTIDAYEQLVGLHHVVDRLAEPAGVEDIELTTTTSDDIPRPATSTDVRGRHDCLSCRVDVRSAGPLQRYGHRPC